MLTFFYIITPILSAAIVILYKDMMLWRKEHHELLDKNTLLGDKVFSLELEIQTYKNYKPYHMQLEANEKARELVSKELTKLTDERDMYKHRLEQLTGVHNV